MNSKERIKRIISRQPADRCGFWLGNPHWETWPILFDYFGTSEEEEIRRILHDDFRWIQAGTYIHPEGKPMLDMQRKGPELSAGGCFSDCESIAEVENYDWPDPKYLNFEQTVRDLKSSQDFYCASGFWSPFFHEVCDFFGMEEYFIKMYSHPDVIHAVTRHLVDFYIEANLRFFKAAGDLVDGFFFGNDLGGQSDILISPELFKEFIFPYFRKLTELGHEYNKQVILHSCGSIYRVIPDLIGFGVDAIHPLQAKAARMDANTLANEFKEQVCFIGGIDTQDLLVNGNPDDIRREVDRIRGVLGPNLIISPSHEAILPNVPPENIVAMAEETTGLKCEF
ncbi:MAG: hypothetical protein HN590_09655 [Calditrichaeota bacterium]|nr:hypothetical protein [Calditrichota bacterium]